MIIKLLKSGDVPMAHYEKNCDCCGSYRVFPDCLVWYLEGEEFDPEDRYSEIDLEAHKDTFKFGEHYTIIAYP